MSSCLSRREGRLASCVLQESQKRMVIRMGIYTKSWVQLNADRRVNNMHDESKGPDIQFASLEMEREYVSDNIQALESGSNDGSMYEGM